MTRGAVFAGSESYQDTGNITRYGMSITLVNEDVGATAKPDEIPKAAPRSGALDLGFHNSTRCPKAPDSSLLTIESSST